MRWWVYSVNGVERGIVTATSEASAKQLLRQRGVKGRISLKLHPSSKGNPRGGRMTKAQRKARAKKAGVERRVAAALKKFFAAKNPSRKVTAVHVKRNSGGSYTIKGLTANRKRR